jgi:hypothetical protein
MRRYLRRWINAKMIIAAIKKPIICGSAGGKPSGIFAMVGGGLPAA